jgi:hypothetical protein
MPNSQRDSRLVLCAIVLVAAALLSVYVAFIRPWTMRWGATDAEITQVYPGDRYIPSDTVVSTRAITIRAPRAVVWSWLIQLGQGRGGFYSFEWLENLFAANMHNAGEINPALQHLQTGDHISFQQDGPFAIVAEVEAEERLVLDGGWAWYLADEGDNATRLVVRYASFKVDTMVSQLFYYSIFEPAHFIMEQGMLLGLRERAEQSVATTFASTIKTGAP